MNDGKIMSNVGDENMIVMQENRDNPRINISLGASVKHESEEQRAFSIVRNISKTGVFITTKKQYVEGCIAQCVISLEDEAIQFKGEIVRSKVHDPYYGYGIEITEIDNKDSDKLEEFIDKSLESINSELKYESDNYDLSQNNIISFDEDGFAGNIDGDIRSYIETDGKESRLLQANFPFHASVEEYNFTYQDPVVKEQIERIELLEWVEKAKNLMLLGPSSSGKTHLAIGIGTKAIEAGYKVSFTTGDALINLLKTERALPRSRYQLSKFVNSRILIIDEFCALPISKHEGHMLYQFLSKLYGRISIVLTSDLTIDQLRQMTCDSELMDLLASNLESNIWLKSLIN